MHSVSFHIYQTPHHHTWALTYKTGALRHEAVYPTQDDALKASFHRAKIAMEN